LSNKEESYSVSAEVHKDDEKDGWNTICHIDLDAWFSSWNAISTYTDDWPLNKDIMFGDTGQVWFNTGLMCVRPTLWTVDFLQKVINAKYNTVGKSPLTRYDRVVVGKYRHLVEKLNSVSTPSSSSKPSDPDNDYEVEKETTFFGFIRDQPALWHVLFEDWKESGHVNQYEGTKCPAWGLCNPIIDPLQCWHWCFWASIQSNEWWTGLESVNKLPHVYLVPQHVEPQFHSMCLRSCSSVLERSFMKFCSLVSNGYAGCYPEHVQELSHCDGLGCARQMQSNPVWLKHSGHKHWTRDLIDTIPINVLQSKERLIPFTQRSMRGAVLDG
jgi:hypothetical protein